MTPLDGTQPQPPNELATTLLRACRGLSAEPWASAHIAAPEIAGSVSADQTTVQCATIALTAWRETLRSTVPTLEYRAICAIAVFVFAKEGE